MILISSSKNLGPEPGNRQLKRIVSRFSIARRYSQTQIEFLCATEQIWAENLSKKTAKAPDFVLNSTSMIAFNPLLEILAVNNDTPIPFHDIQEDHYAPAIEEGIRKAKLALQELEIAPPTYQGIIEGIEQHRDLLERVYTTFSNQLHANTSDKMQEIAKEFSPKLAELSNDLLLNEKIFSHVKDVYSKRDIIALTTEQKMLLDKTYKAFRRNGALLNSTEKESLRKIDKEMSLVSRDFSDRLLKATNSFHLVVDKLEPIKNLPEGTLEIARKEAEEKGFHGKWLFNLQAPSFGPFLQYCTDAKLRKELYTAYLQRGMLAPNDNRDNIVKLVRLRHERAKLLGYESHAQFVLEERMAKTPHAVFSFLDDLLDSSIDYAKKDLEELRALKSSLGDSEELSAWDVAYYSDLLKKKKFNFDEEKLRPYLKLENVIEGLFQHAEKLFGVVFEPAKGVPVYHPDVTAYRAFDKSTKEFLGFFYCDFFPRPSKHSGAWMTNYIEQAKRNGVNLRPHVGIVCNFSKPTASKPSLLTLSEVETAFHEFGHALHSLLSQCHYSSLAGPNVYWDFVELPSQVMENWVKEFKGITMFAKHYETGEVIPEDYIKKIREAAQFQTGWLTIRQLSYAFLDMAWHSTDPSQIGDVEAFETTHLKRTRLLPLPPNTSASTGFSHIFDGGYSAGYYSYKWAEVLDADAFEAFLDQGIYNEALGKKFRECILAKGGSEDPAKLYRDFRGRDPDPKALLRRNGILVE